jgi:uncharacterized protein YndB with AHSA1/START domain
MSSVTNRITIGRPIEDVFAVLTNVEKTGTWFPGQVEEHWTSPPPHGLGSTRRAVVTVLGRRIENDAVATEYEPPHRAAMTGTSRNAPFEATLTFATVDGGTRVEVTSAFLFRGPARILGPLVAAAYGRAWARGLVKLKRMMEAGELSSRPCADEFRRVRRSDRRTRQGEESPCAR